MTEIVSVRTLRNEYARLIARVEAGEAVTIVRHGRPVARLVPVENSAEVSVDWRRSAAHGRRLPQRLLPAKAVEEILEEGGGRY